MSPEPGQHVMPLMGPEDMFTQQCRDFLPTCRPWNSSRHGPKLHPCGQLIFPTANGEGAWTGRPGAPLLGAGFPGIRAPLGPLARSFLCTMCSGFSSRSTGCFWQCQAWGAECQPGRLQVHSGGRALLSHLVSGGNPGITKLLYLYGEEITSPQDKGCL